MAIRFDDEEIEDRKKKFTSLDKMSKKEKREFYAKARGDWNGVNPITKVEPKKKKPFKGYERNDDDDYDY